MAYGSSITVAKEIYKDSNIQLNCVFDYQQDFINNKTRINQITVCAKKIGSKSPTLRGTLRIANTGVALENATTTNISRTITSTTGIGYGIAVYSTKSEVRHNNSGKFPDDRRLHFYWEDNGSTNCSIKNVSKTWIHKPILTGIIPDIDRTSATGSISVSTDYTTATVNYTSKEYGDIYFKDPATGEYSKVKTISSGSKVINKTYRDLEPGKNYSFAAYVIKSSNKIKSSTSTVSKKTLPIPAPTIPTIRVCNLDYYSFNITLENSTATLYDRTTSLGGEYGRLTIKIIGDTTADGEEVEYTKNQLMNSVGYQFNQEQHNIKPDTQYKITITSYTPITTKPYSKTITVKTKSVAEAVLSDLRVSAITPYSFTITGADTTSSKYYDLTTEIEGRYGYLEISLSENGVWQPTREISITQLKKGILFDNLNPETTYQVKVMSETPITHAQTTKTLSNIKTSAISNTLYYKTQEGWILGYAYIKTPNGWVEATPYVSKSGEWIRGIA